VTFNLGTMLTTFFRVPSSIVPLHMVVFAIGNFLGPLLLGRLFDTVGRRPMITLTYLVSAGLTIVLALLLLGGGLNEWAFSLLVAVTFFFASAGASSAYLTVSEIFPMETRALAIAFFYAAGTGLGGIIGPLLFGQLVGGGQSAIALGFFVGAAVMALGGIAEILFGIRAEGMALENIAKPITVADAEHARQAAATSAEAQPKPRPGATTAAGATPNEIRARRRLEEQRARAASGLRRFRPGPGEALYSPGMVGTASRWAPTTEQDLDREIESIGRAVAGQGRVNRDELATLVGAKYWGPRRFTNALDEAVHEGAIRRLDSRTYASVQQAGAGGKA
jgi:MFS family permease